MIECARLSLMALWLAAICEIPERKNKNEKIKFINAFIALISLSKKRKIKIFTTFPYCRFMYVYNDVCVCVCWCYFEMHIRRSQFRSQLNFRTITIGAGSGVGFHRKFV